MRVWAPHAGTDDCEFESLPVGLRRADSRERRCACFSSTVRMTRPSAARIVLRTGAPLTASTSFPCRSVLRRRGEIVGALAGDALRQSRMFRLMNDAVRAA